MTREEAITLIKSALKTMYLPKSKEYISDLGYALEMAIKALEQSYNSIKTELKPCDDAISRQAVLDCFTATKLKKFDFILHAREEIKKLPSVNPQPKTGHWIEHEIKDTCRWLTCSVCGYEWVNKKENFCPNCGCRMFDTHERSGER